MADTGRRAPLAPQNDMTADIKADETRMRRALGLGSGSGQSAPQQRPEQARARHRFVQDGGVPVVMLGQKAEPETAALRERIAALEAQLEQERAAHALARRQLEAEHQAVTALQTRLAHNDLAHKDALDHERHLRETAQAALQQALQHQDTPRRRSTAHAASGAAAPSATDPDPADAERLAAYDLDDSPGDASAAAPEIAAAALGIAPQEKRGRGRPRSTTPPDPKPVRWWTPSYRAQKT